MKTRLSIKRVIHEKIWSDSTTLISRSNIPGRSSMDTVCVGCSKRLRIESATFLECALSDSLFKLHTEISHLAVVASLCKLETLECTKAGFPGLSDCECTQIAIKKSTVTVPYFPLGFSSLCCRQLFQDVKKRFTSKYMTKK